MNSTLYLIILKFILLKFKYTYYISGNAQITVIFGRGKIAATPYIQVSLTSIVVFPKPSTNISFFDLLRPVSADLLNQSATIKVFLHSSFNVALRDSNAVEPSELGLIFLKEWKVQELFIAIISPNTKYLILL